MHKQHILSCKKMLYHKRLSLHRVSDTPCINIDFVLCPLNNSSAGFDAGYLHTFTTANQTMF